MAAIAANLGRLSEDVVAVVAFYRCGFVSSRLRNCTIDRLREELSTYGRYFLENNQDHQLTPKKWSNVAHRYCEDEVNTAPSMNYVGKALLL